MIILDSLTAGELILPGSAGGCACEVNVAQNLHRAVGGSRYCVTYGKARYRLTRKFEALRETEVAAVCEWAEAMPWQSGLFDVRESQPGTATERVFSGCRLIGAPQVQKKSYNNWDVTLVVSFPVFPAACNGDGDLTKQLPAVSGPHVVLESTAAGSIVLPSPGLDSNQETDVNQTLLESPGGRDTVWTKGPRYHRIERNFTALGEHLAADLVEWFEVNDWQAAAFSYDQQRPGGGATRLVYTGVRLYGIPRFTLVHRQMWDVNCVFEFPVHPNATNGV